MSQMKMLMMLMMMMFMVYDEDDDYAEARAWRSPSDGCPPASPTSRGSCPFVLSATNVASPADKDCVIGCPEQID